MPLTRNTPILISVADLDLDPRNPRVIIDAQATQDQLVEYLFERESLDELVMSFVENGFFPEEPLVAVKAEGHRHVVVEGNRRLATLKLLLDADLRDRVGARKWPVLTDKQLARLLKVPVVEYTDRRDVMPFLGFRHITGAKKWAPFQKARFVTQLVDDGFEIPLIQDLIGDSTQAVKKLYQQFVVYQQIVDETDIDTVPIRDRFSLMEVTLGQRPIKAHIGLSGRLPVRKTDALVPSNKLDELVEVIGWVFGNGEVRPVVRESRDISQRLAKVIANEPALMRLRESLDLDLAYELTDGEQVSLSRSLLRAERIMRDAAGLVPLYADDPEIQRAVKRLATMADALREQVG